MKFQKYGEHKAHKAISRGLVAPAAWCTCFRCWPAKPPYLIPLFSSVKNSLISLVSIFDFVLRISLKLNKLGALTQTTIFSRVLLGGLQENLTFSFYPWGGWNDANYACLCAFKNEIGQVHKGKHKVYTTSSSRPVKIRFLIPARLSGLNMNIRRIFAGHVFL